MQIHLGHSNTLNSPNGFGCERGRGFEKGKGKKGER